MKRVRRSLKRRRAQKRIVITTGDLDGIGLEITVKALNQITIPRGLQIFVFSHLSTCNQAQQIKNVSRTIASDLESAFQLADVDSKNRVFVVVSQKSPPLWVEEATKACLTSQADALVTGPLSKPLIFKAGLRDLGHTEILGRLSKRKDLFMSFWGSKANVVLMTGHISLGQVAKNLTSSRVQTVLKLTQQFVKRWNPKLAKKRIALVGINPHAGDNGLIGKDDQVLHRMTRKNRQLIGPLPGDSAFIEANLKKVGIFLASYHDQGLIPFKLLHGFDEGVHVTLGLPFLRTSVDHGPAKELFGKNRANFGSMKQAIEMAMSHTLRSR